MKKVKFGIIGMGNMGTGHLGFFIEGKIFVRAGESCAKKINLPSTDSTWICRII